MRSDFPPERISHDSKSGRRKARSADANAPNAPVYRLDVASSEYDRKRDFGRTPEPQARRDKDRGGPPVFVIHRHEARRLHYDLRLEVDGALASWAVPRGFSFDPSDKRLAVRTEDHPLEYEHFEGVIPAGEYGAGTMQIWDRGTFRCIDAKQQPTDPRQSIAGGELKVILDGRRVRGEWHLVKTKQDENSWLMFKSKDRYAARDDARAVDMDLRGARAKARPARLAAIRYEEEREPFSDPGYLFEMEFAGVRAFAIIDDGEVEWRGLGRRTIPELDEALAQVRAQSAILDGAVVALDDTGRPSRAALDARLRGDTDTPLQFYTFDVLHFEGLDLRDLPLIERKATLTRIVPPSATILYVDHVAGDGERLCTTVAATGLEAVIAKPADGRYRKGHGWVRIPVDSAGHADTLDAALAERDAKLSSRRAPAISNPGKIYWPDEGYTKSDLCSYYAQVADVLLPHLVNRAVHLHRFPDGIEGESFYQHKPGEGAPDWLHVVEIDGSPQIVCDDLRHLIYLGNLGSIDLHPWMSTLDHLDNPDWVVIDLDPKEAPFQDVVKMARAAGRLLRGIGLRPLLKTSGKSGLHVYVPLLPHYTYDQARMFCEGVARVLARENSDIATVERNIQQRGRRVYVDFGQNRKGQTVVAPYVARPVPGATVSTPLQWDELDGDLDLRAFTIKSVPTRVAEVGDLFRAVLTDPQDLVPAIAKLEEYLAS